MLKPWQLIKLKQKYGGIYVIKHNGQLYVARQPTLLEITQQYDQKKVFELDTEEMFLELTKSVMVYPEDPSDIPEIQIKMLAEAMLDDIPLTEQEVENKIAELALENDNVFKEIALELWQQVSGTTIHEFYNRPIKEVLEMYGMLKILTSVAKEGTQQESYEEYDYPNIELTEPQTTNKQNIPTQIPKDMFGKDLDEVLKAMQQGGN